MAQLTEAEKRQFMSKGAWVREKCDRLSCGHYIGFLSYTGRRGGDFCSEACRDAVEQQPTRHRKPREGAGLSVEPPSNVERSSERYVKGFDMIELAVLDLLGREKKGLNVTQVLDSLEQSKGWRRRDMRQGIWNLLLQKRLVKDGWRLRPGKNGSTAIPTNGKPKKILRFPDVPAADS